MPLPYHCGLVAGILEVLGDVRKPFVEFVVKGPDTVDMVVGA